MSRSSPCETRSTRAQFRARRFASALSAALPRALVHVAICMLALAVAGSGTARAQGSPADTVIYTANSTTQLYVVLNRATGATAPFATLAFATTALARDPVTKRIYYLATNASTPLGRVAYYDPATGTNTILNGVGNGDNTVRMTIAPDGTMYAIGINARGSLLYSIDKMTGAYTTLGSVRVGNRGNVLLGDNGDIAFDPVSGILYGSANSTDGSGTSLYSINIATRTATEIGTITNNATQAALTFAAGVLYSGGGAGGELFRVNVATGVGTLVADNNFNYYDFATGPPGADLQVTMTATTGLASGGSVTYSIVARNNGPYPALATVSVVDTLPAGLTYTSATGTGWSCSAVVRVVTCTRTGAVASGTTLPVITLVAAITSSVAPSITNVAWVASSTMGDQNGSNNRAAVTSPVTVRSVAVTPDAATVTQLPSNGTSYTQLFVIANSGSVTDRYDWAVTVAPAGAVTIVSVNGAAATTGRTASLTGGATVTLTVVYRVAANAATGATGVLRVTATSTTAATVTDAGDLTVTVARAGITMSKQAYRDDRTTLITGAGTVASGEYVQYRLTVTSSGGAEATAVSVADALPARMTYDAAAGDAPGWTITNAAGTVTAVLAGTLPIGQSRSFWIRARVK